MASRASASIYKGYMPIGLPQHRPPRKIKPWWKVIGKPTLTIYPPPEVEEWAQEAEYPPLNDGSPQGQRKQFRQNWYDTIKRLPTCEEKLLEITKQTRHYTAYLSNQLQSYNLLPMAQYLTKTNICQGSLPDKYKLDDNDASSSISEKWISLARKAVLDKIRLHRYDNYRPNTYKVPKRIMHPGVSSVENYNSARLIQDVVSSVKKILVARHPFLAGAQLDLDPTVRSWWWHSGLLNPRKRKNYKGREDEEGHINQLVQMRLQPALNIRYDSMLEPLISFDDPLAIDSSAVPQYDYNLKNYGARYRWLHPTMMAGFWFEDQPRYDCPHTTFLTGNFNRSEVNNNSRDEINDVLDSQAIMTAFGWLNTIAAYHGFTPYQELTYPLTCQVVTTDGMDWTFHVYQMNTHAFHRDLKSESSVNNVCWSSGVMQLYKSEVDGDFVQVNDDVLKYLIKFISAEPNMDIGGVTLRPYLSVDTRDDQKRLEDRVLLRSLFENRFKAFEGHHNKIPLWEHIFKRSKQGSMFGLMLKTTNPRPNPPFPRVFG